MLNELKTFMIQSIIALRQQGWSFTYALPKNWASTVRRWPTMFVRIQKPQNPSF